VGLGFPRGWDGLIPTNNLLLLQQKNWKRHLYGLKCLKSLNYPLKTFMNVWELV